MLVCLIGPVTTIEIVQSRLYMVRLHGAEVSTPKKQSAATVARKGVNIFLRSS